MAYARLPPELKRRLNGLNAEFVYGRAKRNNFAAKAAEALDARAKASTVATHPVVVRHAATGEPGLYVSPYTTSRILGLSESESEALLAELTGRIEAEAFRWEHVWSPRRHADVGQSRRPHACGKDGIYVFWAHHVIRAATKNLVCWI